MFNARLLSSINKSNCFSTSTIVFFIERASIKHFNSKLIDNTENTTQIKNVFMANNNMPCSSRKNNYSPRHKDEHAQTIAEKYLSYTIVWELITMHLVNACIFSHYQWSFGSEKILLWTTHSN